MGRIRLSDIAEAAGVSTASVSNALNHKMGINPEKAEEIRRLAAQMGYLVAEEDKRKCMRFIVYKKHGKVVMDTAFFAQLFEGVQDECRRLSCDLIINHVRAGDDVSRLTDMPLLVLATEMDHGDLDPFRNVGHPVLLLDSDFRYEPFSNVTIDNCEAGYMAAKHLVAMGHRKIGFLDSALTFNNMEDRFAGFSQALAEHGLSPFSRVKLEPTVEGANRDMRAYLVKKPDLPTAFFAGNDIIAVGVSMALKKAGYRLPGDLSIIGMDDMPMCQVVEPTLSTIRVDKQRLGSTAVARLLQMMDGQTQVQRTRLGVGVIERDSVLSL
ncbi:MAG: LacI family DNA-binding transcriptional regulator [Clostridia bacterium]|nr:LacI family DNA-binding transcriptional regulator [Clostridia bacterium]